MKVLPTVSLAVLSLSASLLGCGKILDIEEKKLASSEVEDCRLIGGKNASLRVMNAIPSSAVFDLCVKTSDRKDYNDPWFSKNETTCGKGVAYAEYTTDLGISAGTYDVKIVRAGDDCSASGIEHTGLNITESVSVTLLAYGANFEAGRLSVLPNRSADGLDIPVRFINALNSDVTLSAGIADTSTSPATFLVPIYNDVPLGSVATESKGGPTNVDDVFPDGYSLFGGGEISRMELNLGVAEGDSTSLTSYVPLPVALGHSYTLFALGLPNDSDWRSKLWTCDENKADGVFLRCGNPVAVSFEVFNPNLTDAFTTLVAERTDPATEAIADSNADVLCLTELYDPKVREKLKTALDSSKFEYYKLADDVPESDWESQPLLQDGSTPQYNPIACPVDANDDFAALLDTFLQCGIERGCLKDLGDGEHNLQAPGAETAGCFFQCQSEAAALLLKPKDQVTGANCYMCALTHLSSYDSEEATTAACTKESDRPQHFAFDGTVGLGVLSKYPLGEPKVVELPSSYWRRAAMRVPVTLPNGAVVDHWCASLRFPNTEGEIPYAGLYGEGVGGYDGVVNEQKYEATKLIEAVQNQRKETGTPALVGVVTFSGPELKDDKNNILVYSQVPETYDIIDQVWRRLVAADYVPACTFCGDSTKNPLNDADPSVSFWSTHLFADGISPDAVQSTERTFTDFTFTLDPNDTAKKAPVSQHFGLRSVVTVTQ